MSTYRLKNLLSPHSVALVGASPRHGSVGRAILNNIRKAQFKGEFGLVNPRYDEIDGVATAGSIAKLAFAPELVVLTAPARAIAGLIDEAGRRRPYVNVFLNEDLVMTPIPSVALKPGDVVHILPSVAGG